MSAVTSVIARRVPTRHRDRYERRLRQLLADAAHVDGYLGADVHPPADPDDRYVSVVRFASDEQLHRFLGSELNADFQRDISPLVDGAAMWDTHTGLEFWFDPPPGTVVPQPVRWRMALVLGVVVYTLVLGFGAAAGALVGDWPTPLRLALVIAVEIVLMTYVLLPRITAALASWIYPTRHTIRSTQR